MQTFETLELPDSDQHGAALHHYLVTSYSPDMAKEIYGANISTDSKPLVTEPLKIAPLYIATPLADLVSYSPLVVKINNGDALFKHYQKNATNNDANATQNNEPWSGLIVSTTSSITFEQLLNHLRQRVMMRFDSERQAVFHYQNPTVTHYFFAEASQQDSSDWMGPISQINWFGYAASAHHNLWCRVINDQPTSPKHKSQQPDSEVWTLTVTQQRALEIKYDDKLLADFFSDNDMPDPSREQWLKYRRYITEAQAFELETSEHLNQYLALCRQYADSVSHAAQLPALKTLTNAEKLQALDTKLSKDSTYVS